MQTPATVVLMTKYPVPGQTKTRLMPQLTPQQACDVHRAMLLETLRTLSDLPFPVLVAGDTHEPTHKYLSLLDLRPDQFFEQAPGDLGERMSAAIHEVRKKSKNVLLVGTDSPQIPAQGYAEALAVLDDRPMSIGPSDDGGFWCIGLDPTVDPDALWSGVRWSSGLEYARTVENASSSGISPAELEVHYDVDRFDDLRRLMSDLALQSPDCRLLDELTGIVGHGINGPT